MKVRPILFSAPMVRALLAGNKTQTRRIVKIQSPHWKRVVHVLWGTLAKVISCRQPVETAWVGFDVGASSGSPHYYKCPYGQPGDRLWVRETWQFDPDACDGWPVDRSPCIGWIKYAADNKSVECAAPDIATIDRMTIGHDVRWDWDFMPRSFRPSIHMPRWASRIMLEITSVRVERLQDISEADATAEGSPHSLNHPAGRTAVENYKHLWECINGDDSWDANPWVWVIEFKVVQQS